jgi:hypothetical protein
MSVDRAFRGSEKVRFGVERFPQWLNRLRKTMIAVYGKK